MSQPGSSRSMVIQDHQGKRRIVEVSSSAMNQRKSMPASTSTKSQEFQYLTPASGQQHQQTHRLQDGATQAIVVQQMNQSGTSACPSTSTSGDSKKGMFSSTRTATPQKTQYIHGPGSLNKLAQSSMTIAKRNHSLPSTSASTSAAAYQQTTTVTRKRKSDKIGKGLRHFSMKVCEKVEQKGITTYNEVADELVHEEISGSTSPTAGYDQKNIRRRVYDALNVLMAMNIISKEKKEIRWIGLPTNSMRECLELEKENEERRERIAQKQQQLRELILQQISYKNLVKRNREAEERGLVPAPNSAIHMPFIILNTHKKTHINCSISNDKSEYSFKFDDNYEIHDDLEVLKQMKLTMGLDTSTCRPEDVERAKQLVPKAFEKFIDMYAQGVDNDDSNGELDQYPNYAQYDDEYSNMSIKLESIETSDVTDDFNHGDVSADEDDGDSDV